MLKKTKVDENDAWILEICRRVKLNSSVEVSAIVVGIITYILQEIVRGIPVNQVPFVDHDHVLSSLSAKLSDELFQHYKTFIHEEMEAYNTQQYNLQKALYIKNKVVALYQVHNPTKMDTIDSILLKYKDDMACLFRNLRHKYGEESLELFEELAYPPLDKHVSGIIHSPPFELDIDLLRRYVESTWGKVDDEGVLTLYFTVNYFYTELSRLICDDIHYTDFVQAIKDDNDLYCACRDIMDQLAHAAEIVSLPENRDVMDAVSGRGQYDPINDSYQGTVTKECMTRLKASVQLLDADAFVDHMNYPHARSVTQIEHRNRMVAKKMAGNSMVHALKLTAADSLPTHELQFLFRCCLGDRAVVSDKGDNDDSDIEDEEDCLTMKFPCDQRILAKTLWKTLHDRVNDIILYDDNNNDMWIVRAARIAERIPIAYLQSPSNQGVDAFPVSLPNAAVLRTFTLGSKRLTIDVFDINFIKHYITHSMSYWQKKELCEPPPALLLLERAILAGANIEGDGDCGRTPLLDAGPKTAQLLLSHGADPLQVVMKKDFEQDLERILGWGVTITCITENTKKVKEVKHWEKLVNTEEGRQTITDKVRSLEWKIIMKYGDFEHST